MIGDERSSLSLFRREGEYEAAAQKTHRWLSHTLPYHAIETRLIDRPRVGSMELYAINDDGEIVLLFSKLRSKRFPTEDDIRIAIAYVTHPYYQGGDFVGSEVWKHPIEGFLAQSEKAEVKRKARPSSAYYRRREMEHSLLSYSTRSLYSTQRTKTPDNSRRPLSAKARSLNRETKTGTPEETGLSVLEKETPSKYRMREGPPLPGKAGRGKIYFDREPIETKTKEEQVQTRSELLTYK